MSRRRLQIRLRVPFAAALGALASLGALSGRAEAQPPAAEHLPEMGAPEQEEAGAAELARPAEIGPAPDPSERAPEQASDPDFLDPSAEEPVPMVIPDFDRQPAPPGAPVDRERLRWIWRSLTVARVNPLGLFEQFRSGLRVQLSNDPGALWEGAYAALLANVAVSPAFGRFGGRLELAPAAIFRLAAQYDYFLNWGAFNHLQTFDTPAASYDDDTLEALRDENELAGGGALELEALLQAKVGPVAVRNNLNGYLYRMNVPRDRVFYDSTHDALHPNGGWGLQNDVDLLFLFEFGLKLGVRHTYHQVFYPDRFAVEGTAAENNTPTHRVGPAALYTLFDDPPGVGWNKPTLGVLAQWWLKHRYRTGQDISQAIPYLLVVIIQEGDFLP